MASGGLQHCAIIANHLQAQNEEHNGKTSQEESSPGETDGKEISEMTTFPEGGARAWAVAAGAAGVLFCTFGYSNAFG
jgi:hypothetical protein